MPHKIIIRLLVAMVTFSINSHASAAEISLLNARGEAVAYLDTEDELTIYTWSGKPVAYLLSEDVYGFNGKHLGWFINGVLRDHNGDAACVISEIHPSPMYESYKSYKEYKPYKSYTEYAPYKPYFSNSFSATPCSITLLLGSN